ncbi:MAG TPA: efflux RND transporter periplasmic adaptor subunit [Pseudolabrys sp.]|nr:efflux RND transporter periplasmic adaptor subunit [Pseudolabrys sp.]
MNKPVGVETTRLEPATPVALVQAATPAPVKAEAPHPRSRKVWWIAGLLSIALAAAVGGVWWFVSAETPVHYTTAAVTRGAVTRMVTATGTVNPVLTIIVGSYVSGVIQDLACDYNTKVTRGQVCAKIDPRPYQTVVDQNKANLAEAKAQIEKDKATLAYAQLTYDRNARLVQTNAVSKDAFDNAKSTLDQAVAQIGVDEATIAQREAQLATAQVNLDYTDIISPVDGTVVSRNVTMGQTVAASFQTPTLFLIATDLTKMQVDTNVSESDIGGIKEANKALFTVDAFPKRTFQGAVSQVRQSPQTVQNVVTYDVVVSVDNADLALMPGMTAATRIIVDQRSDVLRVPSQALRYAPAGVQRGANRRANDGDQGRVWVLRDGKPVRVPVTTGLDDDTFTEIVKGDLQAGDQVITTEQRDASKTTSAPRLRL